MFILFILSCLTEIKNLQFRNIRRCNFLAVLLIEQMIYVIFPKENEELANIRSVFCQFEKKQTNTIMRNKRDPFFLQNENQFHSIIVFLTCYSSCQWHFLFFILHFSMITTAHFLCKLTLPVPYISESCIEIKIRLNFYFHSSLRLLQRFCESL